MFPGVAAEMGNGPLVRVEQLREPLVGTRVREPAAADPPREHDHVYHRRADAERHGGLAPITLTLLARRRLNADKGPLRLEPPLAQRHHPSRHRLITPRVGMARSQFLIQNPRRIIDLRCTGPHQVGMGGQSRLRHRRSAIGLPHRLPQTPPHGLPIQVQPPCTL